MSYKTDIIPLADLARQYCALGMSKSQVVHFVTDCRLRSDGGYGHGNRAARREARAQEARGHDLEGYAATCERAARKAFGVLHVTNTDRTSFSSVESNQNLECF